VEELLHGETLAERIAKGPLAADEALRVAEEMARGLAHAHHRGVLHRDLKPANVFLCEDGRVKLLDFGLAHLLGREGSSGGGTPAYMAPEQARGEAVDERADVYAAAVILGESLTGRRPVAPATPPEGFSAPAPAAPLDAPGIPRAVARALLPALSTDPASRPRDGAAWLESLRRARRSLERPRSVRRVALLGSAFLVLGLVVAGVATWRVWERQVPGGRPTVAVADFTNETGEKELDGISGLLITSLEQGTQLRVLTRGRMLDVLKQLGRGSVDRIDEPLAREIGRETRARALLLASIRKLGESYVVEMRALDPLHDEYIFTMSDRAQGKAAVFDVVDRLGAATRKRLGSPEAAAPPPRIASITTGNVNAWELLFRSRQAFDRDDLPEARRLAEAALKEDPEFALAHQQLAVTVWWITESEAPTPESRAEALRHVEAAEARADHLPEKERIALRALHATLDGRVDEAARLRLQAAEAYPLDKDVLLHAADALHDDDPGAAIPYVEKVLELDPGHAVSSEMLLQCLVFAGQADRHLAWIRQRAAAAVQPDEFRLSALALLAADQEAEALELWRRFLEKRGGKGGLFPPRYPSFLVHGGRAAEAEDLLRRVRDGLPKEGRPQDAWVHGALSAVLLSEGRVAESRAAFRQVERKPEEIADHEAGVAAVTGSVDVALREMERALAVPAARAAGEDVGRAILAAWLGDLRLARLFAERSGAGSGSAQVGALVRRAVEGILAWTGGRKDDAARIFQAESRQSLVGRRYTGHLLLSLLARERGDCAGEVAELDAARTIPWGGPLPGSDRTYPVLLHRLAACHEKLGDLAKARERNDELLRRWSRADPDLPLLAEAKALQARLPGGPGAGR
jgi:hypothetical protein